MAATILEFRNDAEKVPVRSIRKRRRSAQIVIFPGVRYERYVDASVPGSSDARVERDVLKLVE